MKRDAPAADPLALVLALALAALACAAVAVRWQPGPALPLDAPEVRFSAARALAVLRDLLGGGEPHPAGTAAHARVRERLLEQFAQAGCECSVQETLARGPSGRTSIVRNVVARIPGSSSDEAVLLAAHYDSVGSSPGASDDGAGVAALVEVARALRSGPPLSRAVVFLASDAEEAGLAGASAFAREHPLAREIRFVVNLDARGTCGPSLMFETCGPNAPLVRALARVSPRPCTTSAAELVYKSLPNDTDLTALRELGVPGLNFAFIGGLARYHTPLDDLAHLDSRSLQHHGDNALALARELASLASEPGGQGDLVYADVLGALVLRWPESWSPALGALFVLLAGGALLRGLRSGAMDRGQLTRALLACGAVPLLAVAGGWLGAKALVFLRGAPDPFLAQAWAGRAAVCFGTLALAALAGALLLSRAGFLAGWLVPFALAALASFAGGLVVPEASYLAVLPACGGSLALLSGAASRPRELGRARVAALVPLPFVALPWFAIARACEQGFGFAFVPALAFPLAVIGIALGPAFALAGRRACTLLAAASGALALAAVLGSLALPVRSPEEPGWLNLRYIHSAGAPAGRWEASTFGAPLPQALARAGPFAPSSEPPFPWLTLDPSLYAAAAPAWDAPPPELVVQGERRSGPDRIVSARIRSPRGATRLHLHLPPAVELASASWRGHVLRDGFPGDTHLFFAVEPEGLEIELHLPSPFPTEDPPEVWLLDQDWAMPAEFERLRALRPLDRVPRSDGDVSILGARFVLD